jgi:hypothetical protein
MKEIFGDYREKFDSTEFLIMSFSSQTLPIKDRWRNSGLSANYLADYWGIFFPVHSKSAVNEVQDAVSFISNELLENALKFSQETDVSTIRISLYLFDDCLRFYVTNPVNPSTCESFKAFVHRILEEDTHELYLALLEDRDQDSGVESRLGFLTILNDYGASMGWKFETPKQSSNDTINVTTMVQLRVMRAKR